MRLKNKKTGEMGIINHFDNQCIVIYPIDENWNAKGDKKYIYTSLAELNAEWEDYEEPKHSYYLTGWGEVKEYPEEGFNINRKLEIGNYFSSREEAEKAVKKLKAWKRLKDKGFRFTLTPGVGSLDITPGKFQIEITAEMPEKWFCCDAVQEDLDTCFGSKE